MTPEKLLIELAKYRQRKAEREDRFSRKNLPRTQEQKEAAEKSNEERSKKSRESKEKIALVAKYIRQHIASGQSIALKDIYAGLEHYGGVPVESADGTIERIPVSTLAIAGGIEEAEAYTYRRHGGRRDHKEDKQGNASRKDPQVERFRDRRFGSPTWGEDYLGPRMGPEKDKPGIITKLTYTINKEGFMEFSDIGIVEIPPFND